MKYEICPRCKKRGLYQPSSDDYIINAMIDGYSWICKYCDFRENAINNYKRTKVIKSKN